MKTQTVNGIELAFVDEGGGLPVVLVHGFPLDHSMWNAQIDALSRRYRVIAPDMRGFGRSGVDQTTVGMERLADDLAALLDALEVRRPVAMAGLSMGGYVAFQFWRKYGSQLAGLILLDTRSVADSAEVAAGRLEMAERVLREGPAPLIDNMTPRLFAKTVLDSRPDIVDTLQHVMLNTDRRAIAAALRGMAERPDVTGMLAKIDCPTLVIVGQEDAISTSDEMHEIARAIPTAEFLEIAGSGHMTTMEKPGEVNAALLEFLDTL